MMQYQNIKPMLVLHTIIFSFNLLTKLLQKAICEGCYIKLLEICNGSL